MLIYADMLLFIQFYMVIQTAEPVLKSERNLKRGGNADTSKCKCKFWNRHRDIDRNRKAQTHGKWSSIGMDTDGHTHKQTHTDTHTQRHTNKQTNTHGHTHSHTQRHIYTHTNTHLNKQL